MPVLTCKHEIVGVIENSGRKGQQDNGPLVRLLRNVFKVFSSKEKLKQKYLQYVVEDKDIPYYLMNNGCDEALENWVKALRPDLIFVFSMSELLKENIFSIPSKGTINLHPSFLPDYRGPNPDFWQYYHMEMNPGMSVHYIDHGEDTGNIICQKRTPIELGTKSPERLDKLHGELGVELVLDAMDLIDRNEVKLIKQPSKSTTPRAKLIKLSQHKCIINWNSWEIERIWHVLRGTEIWLNALQHPKVFSLKFIGHRWSVEDFVRCDTSAYQVSKIYNDDGQYFVACSEGLINLSLKFDKKLFIIGLLKCL